MAKSKSCKCGCRARIVSNMVQSMKNCGSGQCIDVCSNPMLGSPKVLSIMAPVIYDEIGINLCACFDLCTDISSAYPTAVTASAHVIDIAFECGGDNVEIEAIAGRPNCYLVKLTNLTVTFAVSLYDENCKLLCTIYPKAVYLPPEDCPTYDEDTNPSCVELEIFAPYGVSYESQGGKEVPTINTIGFMCTNNFIKQGLNLYAIGKALNFNIDDNSITVGLTLVLQSLYFAGYRVENEGKINTPKGSLVTPDNSSCLRFVAGDLLDLAIKPLELGPPKCEERYKQDCTNSCCGVSDVTVPITPPTAAAPPTTTTIPAT